MMNTDAAIVATSLTVARGGREVLHGIDVTIPRASVVGLLGPSGGGKSTFIRAVVGVQIVASGEVRVFGEPAGSPALRRRVGYVTQSPSVYGDLSVRDNVAYFGAIVGASHADVDRGAREAADDDREAQPLAGPGRHRQQRRPRQHPRPAQRRQAVVDLEQLGPQPGQPPRRRDLLVLDEPTVGLDPVLRRDLWDLFHRLAAAGTSLLISSHVMDEATRCDRLLLLRDGRIIADTTPADLLARTGAPDAETAFLALIESAEATR